MRLRTRITMAAATGVAVSVALVAVLFFFAERRDLLDQVDTDLRRRASDVAAELLGSGEVDDLLRPPFGASLAYAQMIGDDGETIRLAPGSPDLPISERALAVAAGSEDRFYTSIDVGSVHLRMLTVPLGDGAALQVARPIDDLDLHLLRVGALLALVIIAGVGLAAVIGRLVARTALRPVERLTAAAERVARTSDLDSRMEVRGSDELARLTRSMNLMLDALARSVAAQRLLVADASHELRTPLTSLRTNLDVLARAAELPPGERHKVLAESRAELDGLIATVGNLIELARDGGREVDVADVTVDDIVRDAMREARRRHGDRPFLTDLEPTMTVADRQQLARLVANLLDNAVAWSPAGGPVEVSLAGGVLSVRDHGPGSTRRTPSGSSTASTVHRRRGSGPARASGSPSSAGSPMTTAGSSRPATPKAAVPC